tara:strand:+ start:4496 stop:5206 length:711 start_codon:yes stop_codon:yes gene_type:complete
MSSKDPLAVVKSLFERLKSEAKTQTTKQMLENINEACAKTHRNGGLIGIVSIVSKLNSSGIEISKRRFYNKNKDGTRTSYRELIDEWVNVSNTTTISGKPKANINLDSNVQMISDVEFKKIDDHALRYKVSLMAGQIKGLNNQLNTMRAIKEQPLLNASDALPLLDNQLTSNLGLNIHEIDLLKDFVKTSKSKQTGFDEDDSLIATKPIARHDVLSQPGLKDIINKIIKSYTLPED